MPDRFANRNTIIINKKEMFKQIKTRRDLSSVTLFRTPKYARLPDELIELIEFDTYTWTRGDRFYKLAYAYYDNPNYWWVIAMFNNAPTEQHVLIGEEIFIPLEPELIASIYGEV